jgi:ubiquinone/menaquinone biosynthesis C-methylase UbiE
MSKNIILTGERLDAKTMPGHWLLARLGKRVLRPGGIELTRHLLEALDIQSADAIVEFAPGLGVTARLVLKRQPASYMAIERDELAAANLRHLLSGPRQQCLVGLAENTKLPANEATVVYGEAMLTMQSLVQKQQIIREAFRLLQPGGRYGIHEMCFVPDTLDNTIKNEVEKALSQAIHVGARPMTVREWRALLEAEGFRVEHETTAPMHLLEPARLVNDEGILGATRFAWNVLRDKIARQRIAAMRKMFKKHQAHIAAVMLVALKPKVSPITSDSAACCCACNRSK